MATATIAQEFGLDKTEVATDIQPAEPVKQQPTLLELAASAAKHHTERVTLTLLPQSFLKYSQRIRSWTWFWIEELFEEFQPWLKWLIFDAALTLIVGWLVKRVEALRPFFEAVGWA